MRVDDAAGYIWQACLAHIARHVIERMPFMYRHEDQQLRVDDVRNGRNDDSLVPPHSSAERNISLCHSRRLA